MFETKKTLIVVYKDELLVNQLRKMIETHDDNVQEIVGTRDNTINIVSWAEKVWLSNKKAGNIQGKILFLGNIKGTDKLIPVIDVKFDEYGVRYGWAGNQAVLFADPKVLIEREDYNAFLKRLSELPVPEFLKTIKRSIVEIGTEWENDAQIENVLVNSQITTLITEEKASDKRHKKLDILKTAKEAITLGAGVVEKVSSQVAEKSEKVLRSRSFMKKQMLFYGVINLYNNGLEEFMNQ